VTAQAQNFVDQGLREFVVARIAESGDPAFGVVKTLTIDFTLDGQPCRASATDPELIALTRASDPRDAEVRLDGDRLSYEVWKPGSYALKTAAGKTVRFEVPKLPDTIEVAGPWELRFPEGWNAPKSVTLDKLISWSDHPNAGVKYFSGTATYVKKLQVPDSMIGKNRRVYLDLGDVQTMARVKLNGRDLGIFWKPPYRVDLTDAVKAGDNALEIEVTNNWINRMIGDEQLPEDSARNDNGTLREWPAWLNTEQPSPTGRFTFTSWRLWGKDAPLQPSGLLGPVALVALPCVAVP